MQLRLDIEVDDLPTALDTALAAGARLAASSRRTTSACASTGRPPVLPQGAPVNLRDVARADTRQVAVASCGRTARHHGDCMHTRIDRKDFPWLVDW